MEPFNKSVYDVLLHNMQLCRRKIFVHRFIYGGEHKNEKEIEKAFTTVVQVTNEDYCEEKLTGVLLLYPNYFIHLVDGDEITFGGHLTRLFKGYGTLCDNVRLFAFYHHINQRFFDEWVVRKAKPPILLEKIDPASDFEEYKSHLGRFITKVYTLATLLRQKNPETDDPVTVGEILPYMSQYLPENVLLNYLVNQEQLLNMKIVLGYDSFLFDTTYMMQNTWPPRTDNIPMNVFESDQINKVIPNLK